MILSSAKNVFVCSIFLEFCSSNIQSLHFKGRKELFILHQICFPKEGAPSAVFVKRTLKAYNTWYSQAAAHPSTNQAGPCYIRQGDMYQGGMTINNRREHRQGFKIGCSITFWTFHCNNSVGLVRMSVNVYDRQFSVREVGVG